MIKIFASRFSVMTCENKQFLKSAQNRVHFMECGAFTVHRQLDIVASTGHPSCVEGWSVFCWRPARRNSTKEAAR